MECPICLEVANKNRYLACGHLFCVECLTQLEDLHHIRCPVCRLYTNIGGSSPSDLPLANVCHKRKARVRKRISVDGSVTSTCVDEKLQRILVVSDSKREPVKIYNYDGDKIGFISHNDIGGCGIGIAVDTKRGTIIVLSESTLFTFDTKGRWLSTISDLDAQFNDISYDHVNDRYIVADGSRKHPVSIQPNSTLTGSTYSGAELGSVYSLGVAKSGAPAKSPYIVINDFVNRKLKYFTCTMENAGEMDTGSDSIGPLGHICGVTLDSAGRAVVSDSGSRRILRSGEAGKWETLIEPETFGFERPHVVYVPTKGPAVVTSYIERGEGCPRKSTVYFVDICEKTTADV